MKILFTENMNQPKSKDIRLVCKDLIDKNFGRLGEMENISICNIPKTRNRFAHVFWSKPAKLSFENARWNIGNQFEQTLALSALSLACLKELNQEVVLYTDTDGYELLSDLGYDRVYNVLDNLNVHNDFWAAGKIFALQNEPLDSCIIDNDIFLYDGSLVDKLSELNVVASHKEPTDSYRKLIEFGQENFSHLKGANEFSSNTGFLKVNDFRLKQMFISAYFNCMSRLSNEDILKKLKIAGNGAFCVDLLCEQFNFQKICKPKYLTTIGKDYTQIKGFTHLLSFEKYTKMPVILNILKDKFPDYYSKVISKWSEIGFSIEVE